MTGYYDKTLSAEKLKKCYELATPRIRRYLDVELNHVLEKIHPGGLVLELGCGYGRVLPALGIRAAHVFGIDTSFSSLLLAQDTIGANANCSLALMNAVQLGFRGNVFDAVVCIQNGISAFHVDQRSLLRECVRVAKSGGVVLVSSYAEKFWNDRLEWFQLQAAEGLVGEIDYEQTRDGVIVCKDGFTATTVSPEQFKTLTSDIANIDVSFNEVDNSSLFCEIVPKKEEH
jgi:ubiquinone/menaquinone biosynthesis C-methylase UbiE